MFGRKFAVQTNTRLVRENAKLNGSTPETTPIEGSENLFDPMVGPQIAAAYSEIAKDFITHAALTIGATFVVCKIVGRLCK